MSKDNQRAIERYLGNQISPSPEEKTERKQEKEKVLEAIQNLLAGRESVELTQPIAYRNEDNTYEDIYAVSYQLVFMTSQDLPSISEMPLKSLSLSDLQAVERQLEEMRRVGKLAPKQNDIERVRILALAQKQRLRILKLKRKGRDKMTVGRKKEVREESPNYRERKNYGKSKKVKELSLFTIRTMLRDYGTPEGEEEYVIFPNRQTSENWIVHRLSNREVYATRKGEKEAIVVPLEDLTVEELERLEELINSFLLVEEETPTYGESIDTIIKSQQQRLQKKSIA